MNHRYAIIHEDSASVGRVMQLMRQFDGLHCVATTNSTRHLENLILTHLPELLILDLDQNCDRTLLEFAALYRYVDSMPKLIGVSENSTHAYKALKAGFFDYWLLPITEFELRKSMMRFKKESNENCTKTICLQSYKDYHYINTDTILYLKSDNNTTDFFLQDGRIISAYKTLKIFEESLPDNFIRVHQSYIVNVNHVSRINYGKSTFSVTNDTSGLPFSKSYKSQIDGLKEILSKNAIYTNT